MRNERIVEMKSKNLAVALVAIIAGALLWTVAVHAEDQPATPPAETTATPEPETKPDAPVQPQTDAAAPDPTSPAEQPADK